MIKTYYELTKSGLVWGNLITTLAGFLFASNFHPIFSILVATLAGAALVIASACVFNNIFDREADSKMPRTKKRALVSGAISVRGAVIFGTVLALAGFSLLFLHVGTLPAFVALLGFAVYTALYTPLKYRSSLTVFIGSIAGACPIAIGYSAALGRLDLAGVLLFLTMVLWQMPHFYSIALFRRADYAAAGIPVLSVTKGNAMTYRYIIFYIILYFLSAASLNFFGYAGFMYLAVVSVMALAWLVSALKGAQQPEDIPAARRMFFISIAVVVSFATTLSFAPILP